MSLKQDFINYIESVGETHPMPESLIDYWNKFKGDSFDKEKPMFTANGKLILKFMQENVDVTSWKAKDIAEGLFISARSVSGGLRKLVTDNFVDKIGTDPGIYCITDKGKNINID